jgi:hypothetical protein
MKAHKIINFINDFLNHQQPREDIAAAKNGALPANHPLYYIGELYAECLREIAEEEMKKTRGASYTALTKKVKKEIESNPREFLRAAWTGEYIGETFQMFINSTSSALYMLREPLGVQMVEEAPVNYSKIIPRYLPEKIELFNFADAIAEFKAATKEERRNKTVKIGCKYFSPAILKQVIDFIGEIKAHYQTPKWNEGDIVEGARGLAFVLPVRPPKE